MDAISQIRFDEIKKIQAALEDQQNHYNKTSAKFKRWHTRCQTACAFSVGATSVVTGSGFAAALTTVGLPVGASLIGIGFSLSLVSAFFGGTIKFLSRKMKKHKEIIELVDETLSEIISLTSAALNDGKITEEEFYGILKKYDSFTSRNMKLRYANHTDGPKKSN